MAFKIFLSGSIDKSPDLGKGWREKIKQALKDIPDLIIYDPCEKDEKFQLNYSVDEASHIFGKLREDFHKGKITLEELKEYVVPILEWDLNKARTSDLTIVYLPKGVEARTTYAELQEARKYKRMVIVITDKTDCGLIVYAAADRFFKTIDEAVDFIRKVLKNND